MPPRKSVEMSFKIHEDLSVNPELLGTVIGHLLVEERDIKSLYAYLQNGDPVRPEKDQRGISLQISGKKCTDEQGNKFLKLAVEPDPQYRRKEIELAAESLAAFLKGDVLHP